MSICPQLAAKASETFEAAYRAYRYANALRETAVWGPGEEGVPDDLCTGHYIALDTFLLTPAPNIHGLARKLEVFRSEEIEDGWHAAGAIVAILADDARRLADKARMEARHD